MQRLFIRPVNTVDCASSLDDCLFIWHNHSCKLCMFRTACLLCAWIKPIPSIIFQADEFSVVGGNYRNGHRVLVLYRVGFMSESIKSLFMEDVEMLIWFTCFTHVNLYVRLIRLIEWKLCDVDSSTFCNLHIVKVGSLLFRCWIDTV